LDCRKAWRSSRSNETAGAAARQEWWHRHLDDAVEPMNGGAPRMLH
jgi:hypothetical protein